MATWRNFEAHIFELLKFSKSGYKYFREIWMSWTTTTGVASVALQSMINHENGNWRDDFERHWMKLNTKCCIYTVENGLFAAQRRLSDKSVRSVRQQENSASPWTGKDSTCPISWNHVQNDLIYKIVDLLNYFAKPKWKLFKGANGRVISRYSMSVSLVSSKWQTKLYKYKSVPLEENWTRRKYVVSIFVALEKGRCSVVLIKGVEIEGTVMYALRIVLTIGLRVRKVI